MIAENTNTSEDLIICTDVHKWYDDFHALQGITLTVKKGEVVVICGPSGSGKSTFIRTINRLEEHQRGQIIVNGKELTRDLRNIHVLRPNCIYWQVICMSIQTIYMINRTI